MNVQQRNTICDVAREKRTKARESSRKGDSLDGIRERVESRAIRIGIKHETLEWTCARDSWIPDNGGRHVPRPART